LISVPLFLSVLAVATPASNLLVNGDFEQPLDVGWADTAFNLAGEARFQQSDTLGQPSPGLAAKVYKTLADCAMLSQTVDVPSANLSLQFDGRLAIGGGSSTCWPVAAFMVRYLDAAGVSLGNTRIYLHDQYCTWERKDTQSLIEVNTPGVWTPFTLDIASELSTNLPGIDPASVRRVRFDLFAFDNGT
jgi:uncharacterized protein (DUF779 family)